MRNLIYLFVIVFSMAQASPALAKLDLAQAKAKGLVGEKQDGYLGVVQANPEANALVEYINSKRRSAYEKMAKENKVGVAQIEKMAASKAINKTAPGHYVESAPGTWKKK